MTVEILPMERRHVAGFHAVLDAVARERRYLAMTEAPPVTQVRRFVLNNLRSGAAQFVAVDDGRVAGWCDVTPKAREAMRHSGVLGMGVAAPDRRRGIGRRLLDEALAAAFAGGLSRVELAVLVDNTPAVALYRTSGFETEGLCRRYLVLDGVAHDAFLMAKLA